MSTSDQHTRTREDHASEIAEDYLEAIADFIAADGKCRAVDLARKFGVSHVTVNRTVGRLQRDGFVKTEPYRPIELTRSGKRIAARSSQRHETVLEFLLALGVSEKNAIIDSEGIEHHVSDETLAAMRSFITDQSR
ncbi:MAG: manganese-binding transcriptional regulator MntR [Planctomycetaceae bacterium]